MNKIMIFENEEFGKVRTIDEEGKVLFCGKDVACALGYRSAKDAISAHCKGAVKHRTLTNGGTQELLYIPEGDVYRLIAHSRLPSAERFEKWVFDEVLPTIRKTGGYVDDPDKFADYYLPFADEATKQMFKIQHEYIRQLHSKIDIDKPDRGIRIGRNRLFAWLRVLGILMMNNIPYQEYMDRGYFKLKESLYYTDGVYKTRQTTYVTGKGQRYIIDRLLRDYASEVYEIA